jgi:hypothetical protein
MSDPAISSEYAMEEMCRDSNSHAISSQMEYVSFFSHIDPIWFPGDVDEENFESQMPFARDRAIHCS